MLLKQMKNAANIGGDNKVGAEVIKCVRTILPPFSRNYFTEFPKNT